MTDFDPAETSQRHADIADSVTARTKELMARRTETLRKRAEEAEAERDEMRSNYEGACKTIAAMHAAAVGMGFVGPIRGVVEDVEDVRLRAEQITKALHIHLHALRARAGREITTDFVRAVLERLIEHPEEVCDLDQNEAAIARVHALYDGWVKAGAPPIGTSMARWWDARLVELREAIRPPEEEPVLGAESLVDQDGEPLCTCTYGERCPNCRD